MREETKDKLRQVLDDAIARQELAGANFLVRKAGREVFYMERGFADREAGIPLRRDQIFRLFSMSKPLTGVAALKLFEDGVLDLAEPVSRYLPAYRHTAVEQNGTVVPAKREILIKDLLDMTSGLMYDDTPGTLAGRHAIAVFRELDERLLGGHPMSTLEFAEKMAGGPLAFHPGSRWLYGASADVLGAVIEAASGMRFGDYLKAAVLDPLGMEDTGFFVPAEKRHRLVSAYRHNGAGELVPYTGNNLGIRYGMEEAPAFESGGAGLASTIDDYARFAQMLLNEGKLDGVRILRPETVRFLRAGSLNPVQELCLYEGFPHLSGHTYGNLFRVLARPGGASLLGHAGEYGWDGWLGCYFSNDPGEQTTVLMMMQRTDAGMTPLVRKLRNVLFGE